MTSPENLDALVPLILIGIVLLAMVFAMAGRRKTTQKRPDVKADKSAAYQAERDSLRANHAVEIAALEGKLAKMQSRAGSTAGDELALKEAQTKTKAAEERAAAAEEARAGEAARAERLEKELAETTGKLTTATAGELRDDDHLAKLAKERDEALEKAAEGAEALKAAVSERDSAIARLGDGSGAASGGGEGHGSDELRTALAAAQQREADANESLSKLAYDRDGLQNRLDAAERQENATRNELEKRDAVLELRQQRIDDLEQELREKAPGDSGAPVPGWTAEDGDAEARERLEEANARIATLKAELTRTQEERDALAALGGGQSDGDAPGDASEVSALRAQVERLQSASAKTGFGEEDVVALRAEIKELAEKFLAGNEPEGDDASAQPTLADRIRAFKAARSAEGDEPPIGPQT